MAVSPARDELLLTRVERFTRMLHGVEEGDVSAVHRTRVASRRLREVLPVLQLDPDVSEKLSKRLRKVTQRLGPMRELDVLLAVIEELGQTDRYSPAALERVAVVVRGERERIHARFAEKRSIAELTRLARKLEKIGHELELEDANLLERRKEAKARQWVLEARAARRASALASAMTDAGAVYQPERLHAVRIAVKKLRYALEVSADAARVKSTPDLRLLKNVQDALGRLHDLHVLVERVRQLQASAAPPDVTTWRQLNALELALENDCRRLHARYMREHDALAALCGKLTGHKEVKTQKLELKSSKSRRVKQTAGN